MKYGRIVYNNPKNSITEYTNVGDWIQTFAIDELYKKMGVSDDDIIEINRSELTCYKGEKCVVIMQGWFNQLEKKDFFPLSSNLIPIFIGFHRIEKGQFDVLDNTLIGCRDEATYNFLKKNGNNVYLSGCLTITLPKREKTNEQKETFFVDVPEKLFEYVPKELMENSHKISHEIFNRENPEEDSKKLLEMYKEKAALVITSRLHCAAPCLALGIPVILVRNYFDDRYSWIDKYIKLYTPEQFDRIDWTPEAIDIEDKKQLLFEIFEGQINNKEIEEKCEKISEFYLKRQKTKLKTPLRTKAFWKLSKINPELANFIRLKILKRFTVIDLDVENK